MRHRFLSRHTFPRKRRRATAPATDRLVRRTNGRSAPPRPQWRNFGSLMISPRHFRTASSARSTPDRTRKQKPRIDRSRCGAITYGGGRIRTFEDRSRQIYSLLPLTAWLLHPLDMHILDRLTTPRPARADGENRTRNRLITNQVLCQLSYVSLTRQRLPRASQPSPTSPHHQPG